MDIDSSDIEVDGPCDVCGDDEYETYFDIDGVAHCPSCFNDEFGDSE